MALVSKTDLQNYAGYNTAGIEDDHFNFVDSATLDWANAMTGQSYTEDTAPQQFKLLCVMLIAELFRARQRLGAEASEINLDGLSASYAELQTKSNIKRLIDTNTKVLV